MVDFVRLANSMRVRFGMPVIARQLVDEEPAIRLDLEGLEWPNGFSIRLSFDYRTVEAQFTKDSFSKNFFNTILAVHEEQRAAFASVASALASTEIKIDLKINQATTKFLSLPEGPWRDLSLSCYKLTDRAQDEKDAEDTTSACLALILSLIPFDATESEPTHFAQGLPEGAVLRVEVNRYERSPANRAAAIAIHGAACHACDFDFGKTYGALGQGHIEIHHRTPVSKMGGSYVVSPRDDLVPLCSNCHDMVHRQDPPLTVETLREIIRLSKAQQE